MSNVGFPLSDSFVIIFPSSVTKLKFGAGSDEIALADTVSNNTRPSVKKVSRKIFDCFIKHPLPVEIVIPKYILKKENLSSALEWYKGLIYGYAIVVIYKGSRQDDPIPFYPHHRISGSYKNEQGRVSHL